MNSINLISLIKFYYLRYNKIIKHTTLDLIYVSYQQARSFIIINLLETKKKQQQQHNKQILLNQI